MSSAAAPAKAKPSNAVPGICRYCFCTERAACRIERRDGLYVTCSWADESKTLCTNPDCLEKASEETR
jgi:hypothetical protein